MLDASGAASTAVERRKASAPEARTDGNVRFCVARAASVDAASDCAPFGAPPPFLLGGRGLSCSGVAKLGCKGASRERWRLTVLRHPEVAAKRPSKGAGRGAGAISFEARRWRPPQDDGKDAGVVLLGAASGP